MIMGVYYIPCTQHAGRVLQQSRDVAVLVTRDVDAPVSDALVIPNAATRMMAHVTDETRQINARPYQMISE